MGRLTEEDIFTDAIQKSPSELPAFLDQACGGDQSLRVQVEALLAAHDQPDSLLDVPACALQIETQVWTQELLGTQIGPYKLREELGDGGMGIVYAAEQEQPIRRKVAIKVIKPGMDSREVIARFQAERHALALMDHPNIARVLDAGTTESGRPYFVMELVRGLPITDYCDRARLALRERLKLFILVCQAVQHAHQKGIIHRDLKPSNVMITLHDGTPVPKVIDFGVAKALNQRLTDQTIYTRNAQLLGTPLYMSPEQAELSGLEVDTRSDVYSLGVLLYELLSGQTPFDKKTFAKLGFDELRRMIREDEPPRLSARISTLAGENRSTVAHQRGIDERHLARTLRGELDWIVMKSLEKDRTRRYGTADALAADVQRYLDDDPVQACPPSLAYRLRKFVWRNRSTVSAVCLALIFGIVLAAIIVVVRDRAGNEIARVAVPEAGTIAVDSGDGTESGVATIPTPLARPPGRTLPGLVPDPPLIPGVGRWQFITKKPRGFIRCAAWNLDETLFAVAEANHVRIYDASALVLLHVLVGHTQPVRSVVWHPDGKRLASGSEDGTVRLWTREGVPTHLLEGHTDPVNQVAWRTDGTQLASASDDGTAQLWNDNGELLHRFDEGGRHVFGIDWSPGGSLLATVGGEYRYAEPTDARQDNSLRIWNADTGELVRRITVVGNQTGMCVAWHPDGRQLAIGYEKPWIAESGPNLQIWNSDGTAGPQIGPDVGEVWTLAWHPDGRRLAFGGYRGTIEIWDANDQRVTSHSLTDTKNLFSVAWSKDGSRLLTASRETVLEWDGTAVSPLTMGIGAGFGNNGHIGFGPVRWSPDGSLIAASQENGSQRFWTADGTLQPAPERPAAKAPAWWESEGPDWHPDGSPAPALSGLAPDEKSDVVEWSWSSTGWLAAASRPFDSTIRIWNDVGEIVTTCADQRIGEQISWSPDGQWLVLMGGDSLRLFKSDGTRGSHISGHPDSFGDVSWSPDGQWIAAGNDDAMLRLWRPAGTAGPALRGHQGYVGSVAWSPDSRKLASGGWDGNLRVWDVETGRTEWQVLQLAPEATATLNQSGQMMSGDRVAFDTELLFLREKSDGSMEILSPQDFINRFGGAFVSRFVTDNDVENAGLAFRALLYAQNPGNAVDPQLKPASFGLNVADFFVSHGRDWEATLVYTSALPYTADKPIYSFRGAAYMRLKQYDKALADISKAVELNPKDVNNFFGFDQSLLWESPLEVQDAFVDLATKAIELSPRNYHVRASYYVHRGEHDAALADIDKAIEVWNDDDSAVGLYYQALLRLEGNDIDGYRSTCQEMVDRFKDTSDPETAHWVAWTCALAPNAVSNLDEAVRFAKMADRDADERHLATLGAVLYRTGRFEQAVETLSTCVDMWESRGLPTKDSPAYTWFILAMAHHHLGHTVETADSLKRGSEQAREELDTGSAWNRQMTLRLLQHEAERELGVVPKSHAVSAAEPTPPPNSDDR